jgi:hypothetical protein
MTAFGSRNRRDRSPAYAIWILAWICLASVGCARRERVYEAGGRVIFKDGSPATDLESGAVVFITPDLRESARGDIAADASFRLETLDLRKGALAREYIVVVMPPEDARRLVPHPRHTRPETSGIRVDVRPGEENRFEIAIEGVEHRKNKK